MTREEAREALSVLKIYDNQWLREAIDMAIEALSAKPQTDLISRADAIRWVKTECNPYGKPTLDYDSGLKVIEHLKKMPSELPSADAVQGEWVEKGEYAECSICGAHSGTQFDGVEPIPLKSNFCPNCGARMEANE